MQLTLLGSTSLDQEKDKCHVPGSMRGEAKLIWGTQGGSGQVSWSRECD